MSSAISLKTRHREVRDSQSEQLRVRIHRAISWLSRAEQEPADPDAQFLFLWIALNAAYAREFGFEQSEREQVRQFVDKLLKIDGDAKLHQALFRQFTGPIRMLIENRYVFEPFWKALREHDSSGRWEEQFSGSRRIALKALMDQRTDILMSIVLDRLHVLRNQLVHGGATWAGDRNRAQLADGVAILALLVPTIIELMMESVDVDFEPIAYPVVP